MFQIKKTIYSFKYALKGIYWMIFHENNAKVHLLATILVLFLGCYFKISHNDWRWIVLSIALVWAFELINTAIEKTIDLVTKEKNKFAGTAKDLMAGAVLIVSLFALYIAFSIFLPFITAILV